jgi:CHAT domain-containing protein
MVERWIRRHCSSESLDTPDAEASLSALQDLVEPLKTLARPGDLLVFCPTSNLHRVPLHAIRLNDHPIIEEFPIIYSHGLSVFRSNFLRQFHGPKKISQQPCVFGNPTSDRPATETAAREFSSNFEDARLYLGKAASKSEFNNAAKVGPVLFFSGHTLGSEDPLEDGLLFGDGVLTAKEISESVMDGNPHVGLIACASSRQKYTVGNEPLGLQAAFIIAGASSVLATLWPIDGESGRLFSKHFYGTLMSREVSNSPTNLATAYQEAVRKMRNNPETITLYHWAPFVLYGSWFSEKLITR